MSKTFVGNFYAVGVGGSVAGGVAAGWLRSRMTREACQVAMKSRPRGCAAKRNTSLSKLLRMALMLLLFRNDSGIQFYKNPIGIPSQTPRLTRRVSTMSDLPKQSLSKPYVGCTPQRLAGALLTDATAQGLL
jgi:hypothetical protein